MILPGSHAPAWERENNNIDDTENKNAILTISVVSENGDATKTVSRTLIKPVVVTISPIGPSAGDPPSGGSETTEDVDADGGSGYTILCGDGVERYCDYNSTITYNAGVVSSYMETVTVTDDITGQSASTSYMIP